MATQWKRQYGPTVTPDAAAHTLITIGANQSFVITKFTVSNNSGSAATATIKVTPAGGALSQIYSKVIPAAPVSGGVIEVVELEGQILGPADTLAFTDGTGGVLIPWISGVAYTQQ